MLKQQNNKLDFSFKVFKIEKNYDIILINIMITIPPIIMNPERCKNMKKALLIIIVLTLFGVLSFTAFADDSAPVLNAKKKEIPIGTSFKLKVKNYTGKASFKSSNPKIAKVSANGKITAKKPGKATITAKVNGKVFKCKVTSKVALKITYKFKKRIKINVGQSKKIKKIYKYTTNLATLKKYVSAKKYKKFKKQVNKKAKHPKAKIKDTKIAKVANKSIKGKNKGKTKVVVSCGKQNFNVGVDVTKLTETTFKGEKTKVAYSAEEAYQLYKKPLVDYYIKGERPNYRYIQLAYATNKSWDKVEDEIDKIIAKNYDSNDNFYSIEHQLSYCFNNRKDNNIKYMDIDVYSDERIKEFKKLYNAAQDILNSINIDSFEEDYEKMIALWIWYEKNCGYGKCPYSGSLNSEKGLIYDSHIGVCTDYALATNYFCALMGIPSIRTDNMSDHNHEWNLVRIQNKWYHYDANNSGVWFIGDDYLGDIFLMNKFYTDLGWQKKVSDTSFTLYKSKIIEISEKCGITEFEVIKVNLTTGEKTKSTAPVWRSFDGSHNFIKDT